MTEQPPIINSSISYISAEKTLVGKKILITGCDHELGLSLARKFISEGAEVLISGSDWYSLNDSAEQLGCKCRTVNLKQTASFPGFLGHVEKDLGGVNCLVHAADVAMKEADILEVTPEGFDAQLNTNLRGAYFLTQSFVKLMESKRRKDCSVLFVSSQPVENICDTPYEMFRYSRLSYVQGSAVRLLRSEIRVNAIELTTPLPTHMVTKMVKSAPKKSEDAEITETAEPVETEVTTEEIAPIAPTEPSLMQAACFLLADSARCITGQIIQCKGSTL